MLSPERIQALCESSRPKLEAMRAARRGGIAPTRDVTVGAATAW